MQPTDTQKLESIQTHSDQADQFAASYEKQREDPYQSCFTYSRRRLDSALEPFLPREVAGLRLLDVGCGVGHHLARLRSRGSPMSGTRSSLRGISAFRSRRTGSRTGRCCRAARSSTTSSCRRASRRRRLPSARSGWSRSTSRWAMLRGRRRPRRSGEGCPSTMSTSIGCGRTSTPLARCSDDLDRHRDPRAPGAELEPRINRAPFVFGLRSLLSKMWSAFPRLGTISIRFTPNELANCAVNQSSSLVIRPDENLMVARHMRRRLDGT